MIFYRRELPRPDGAQSFDGNWDYCISQAIEFGPHHHSSHMDAKTLTSILLKRTFDLLVYKQFCVCVKT